MKRTRIYYKENVPLKKTVYGRGFNYHLERKTKKLEVKLQGDNTIKKITKSNRNKTF